jgi:hypothetical protein
MDDKDFEGMTVKGTLEELRRELGEDQQFLAQYLLSPDADDEAAERERVQDVLKIAAAVDDILGHFLQDMEDSTDEGSDEEPFQMTYNTHAVGVPDDNADNIESDWTIDTDDNQEEPMPFFLGTDDKKKDKKDKKAKKSKKDKKGKKNKKSKKDKKNKKNKK